MASPTQVSDAWIRARDLYVQDLSDEEQQTFFRASPESIVDDASNAESNHGMKSTTRSVIEKLQPLVAAIEQYGHAVDVYSSTYPLALGPIWGSIKVLLHASTQNLLDYPKMLTLMSIRSHVNLANTLTSLLTCLRELAMSYRAFELMRDSFRITIVLFKHSQWPI